MSQDELRRQEHLFESVKETIRRVRYFQCQLDAELNKLEMWQEQKQMVPFSEMHRLVAREMSTVRPFIQAYESFVHTFSDIIDRNNSARHMENPVEWLAAEIELCNWMHRETTIFAEHDQAYWDAREACYVMQAM